MNTRTELNKKDVFNRDIDINALIIRYAQYLDEKDDFDTLELNFEDNIVEEAKCSPNLARIVCEQYDLIESLENKIKDINKSLNKLNRLVTDTDCDDGPCYSGYSS